MLFKSVSTRSGHCTLMFHGSSNLDTDHPKSIQVLRSTLADHEAAKKRDRERGRVDEVKELGSVEGLQRYAVSSAGCMLVTCRSFCDQQSQRDSFATLRADALKRVRTAKKAKQLAAEAEGTESTEGTRVTERDS